MYILNPGDRRDVVTFSMILNALDAAAEARKVDPFARLYRVYESGSPPVDGNQGVFGRAKMVLEYSDAKGRWFVDDGSAPIKVVNAAKKALNR